jgi:hypothetical protein
MSENRIDRQLKAALRNSGEAVPATIDARIEEALAALSAVSGGQTRGDTNMNAAVSKKVALRRGQSLMGRTAVAAAVAVVLLIGSALFIPSTRAQITASPLVQKAVQVIPLLGSLLDVSTDEGVRSAKELGYVTEANVAATDQGITMLIREVVFDGYRIKISYEVQAKERVFAPKPMLMVNGKVLEGGMSSNELERQGANVSAGTVEITPEGASKLPDSFTLGIRYDEVYVRQGEEKSMGTKLAGQWSYEVPVRKANLGERRFAFEKPPTYRDEELELLVHSVTTSKTATAVEVEAELPKKYTEKGYLIDWKAYDAAGKLIPTTGSGVTDSKVLVEDAKRLRSLSTMLLEPTDSTSIKLVCVIHKLKEEKPGEWKEIGTKEAPVTIDLK